MSELVLSLLISVAILAGLCAWVPFLHICHRTLSRFKRDGMPRFGRADSSLIGELERTSSRLRGSVAEQ